MTEFAQRCDGIDELIEEQRVGLNALLEQGQEDIDTEFLTNSYLILASSLLSKDDDATSAEALEVLIKAHKIQIAIDPSARNHTAYGSVLMMLWKANQVVSRFADDEQRARYDSYLDTALGELNKEKDPELLVQLNVCLAQREVNRGNKKNATEFYEMACYRLEGIEKADKVTVGLAKLDYCDKVLFPETKTLEVLTEACVVDNFVGEEKLKYYNGVNLLVACAKIFSLMSRLCKREVEDGALGSMAQAERLAHLTIDVLEKEDTSNNIELSGILADTYANAGEFYVMMMNAYQNVTEEGLEKAMVWYKKAIPIYARFPELVPGYIELLDKKMLIHSSRMKLSVEDGEKVLDIIRGAVSDVTASIGGNNAKHTSDLAAKSEYWYCICYSTMGNKEEAMKHGKENLKQVAMTYRKDSKDPMEHENMYTALDGLFDIYWNSDGSAEAKEKAFHLLGTMMDAKERVFNYTPATMQDINWHGVKKIWDAYRIGSSIYAQMPKEKYLSKLNDFETNRIGSFLEKCNERMTPDMFLPDEQHVIPNNLKETILPAQIKVHMANCYYLIEDYDTALARCAETDLLLRQFEERFETINPEAQATIPAWIYRSAVGFGVARVHLLDAYRKIFTKTNDVALFKADVRKRMIYHIKRTLMIGAEHINADIIDELIGPIAQLVEHLDDQEGGKGVDDETEKMLMDTARDAHDILVVKYPDDVVEDAPWNAPVEEVNEGRLSRLSIGK